MANGHGGSRAGAGRPELPEGKKKVRIVIFVDPHLKEMILRRGGASFIRKLIERARD